MPARDPQLADDFSRVWLGGALITLGDALADANYFDRAPELEMVRHLRNGIAHGNHFEIREPQRLAQYPAHTRDAATKSDLKTIFEITPQLNGTVVLFDFMQAGDVLDLLLSVTQYWPALPTDFRPHLKCDGRTE